MLRGGFEKQTYAINWLLLFKESRFSLINKIKNKIRWWFGIFSMQNMRKSLISGSGEVFLGFYVKNSH